jgi:drug/metabolite transporter (DMT)-like permease
MSPSISPSRQRVQGMLLIALSTFGFGSMAIFTRFAYADGADLYGVLIARFWAAGLLLLAVALLRRLQWPSRNEVVQLGLMGGIGYVGMSYCYFAALNHLPASLVSLILYTYPMIVTLLAVLFLHEKVSAGQCGILLLCAFGTMLTIGANGTAGGAPASMLGIGLALGASVIYAGYITAGSRVTRHLDPVVTTAIICLASATVFTLLALVRAQIGMPIRFPATLSGWGGVAGVTLASTVIAVIAFFAGLKRLGAAQAAMLSTMEPLITVGLAGWLLSEALTMWQWVGGALTLSGVVMLAGLGRKNRPAVADSPQQARQFS